MIATLRRNWEVVFFVLALMVAAFAYGVSVTKLRIWPYRQLNMAFDAGEDWWRNWRRNLDLSEQYVLDTDRTTGGVVVHDRELAWPGLTLVSGYRPEAYQLWLFDMDGRIVHQWEVPMAEAFPTVPPHLDSLPQLAQTHGAVLTNDGDLIVNVVGAGTVRLDRCSRVTWVHVGYTHHAIDLLPDGTLLVPDQVDVTERRADRPRIVPGPNGFYIDHGLLHLGADGEVLRHVSISDAIHQGDRVGMLLGNGTNAPQLAAQDPYHMNDVEMLRPEMAAAFPMFAAGDIMISLRNLSRIAVLDGTTWLVKWTMGGPFFVQHDPDFLPNGHILVFDNHFTVHGKTGGRTRLLEIDPVTQAVVWSYGDGDDETFYSDTKGKVQKLPNGNVLTVWPEEGRVFEVAPAHGNRIVWDLVNLVEPGKVGLVVDVERYSPEGLTFLGQPCQ